MNIEQVYHEMYWLSLYCTFCLPNWHDSELGLTELIKILAIKSVCVGQRFLTDNTVAKLYTDREL